MFIRIVLSLTTIKDFIFDVDNIQQFFLFKLSKEEIENSLSLLIDECILVLDPEKKGTMSFDKVLTGSDKKISSVHKYYNIINDISSKAISISPEEREFQCFTIGLNKDELKTLKALMRKSRDQISKLSNPKENNSIYQVSLQAFPLSNEHEANLIN